MKIHDCNGLDRLSCPIMKAMTEIGDKWVLLLLREAFMGTKRFEQFRENLGISKSVLSTKLKMMQDKELLHKVDYQEEGARSRAEYILTEKGKDLLQVIVSLLNWGNQYLVKKGDPTFFIVDEFEKNPVTLSFMSSSGNQLRRRDLERVVGKK